LNNTNTQVEDGAKGVTVGNTIAIIGEEGDDPAGAEALANESSSSSSESKPSSDESSSAEKSSKTGDSQPTSSEASSGESKSSSSPQKDDSTRKDNSKHTPALGTPADEKKYGSGGGSEEMKAPEMGGDKPKFFASPLARKIALEKGVPLGKVKGTGPEGRITEVSLMFLAPSFVFGYHRRNGSCTPPPLRYLPLVHKIDIFHRSCSFPQIILAGKSAR
jgi:pyruvate dehydrogenase E2 component (dihydrolipoamide acetyltransferase)